VVSLTRLRVMARNAGRNVSDAATINSTPAMAPTAKPFMNARPIKNMPHSEISTAVPANSTARPLVSIASTMASSTSSP
jgi:hypothetical protein